MPAALHALILVCTLSPSPKPSSSQLLDEQVLDALAEHEVSGEVIRVVDRDVRPGVELDMGAGDQWPAIRQQLLQADILVVATRPGWDRSAASATASGSASTPN